MQAGILRLVPLPPPAQWILPLPFLHNGFPCVLNSMCKRKILHRTGAQQYQLVRLDFLKELYAFARKAQSGVHF
jgi:hypothetical protein